MSELLRDSYTVDLADELDSPEEILADQVGCSIEQAKRFLKILNKAVASHEKQDQSLILARILGVLIESSNLPVMVYCMAIAAGLDQLNGIKSEAEVAKKLGVTRSLISHYVVGFRDILSGKDSNFDCLKFRKSNESRKVFQAKATDPFTAAKNAAKQRHKQNVKSYIVITPDGRRFIVQAKTKDLAINQAQADGIEIVSIELAAS